MVPTRRRLSLDHVGTGVACACAVHCLATPFLVVAFPMAAWLGEGAELAFIIVSLGVSTVALLRGAVAHQRAWPVLLLAAAAGVLACRRLVEEGPVERGLVVAAASLLAAAHVLNVRAQRRSRASSR